MRRTALSTALLTVLAAGVIGAQNCTTSGPTQKSFAAGSLVIPMDDCYQRRTPPWTASGTCTPACASGFTCVSGSCLANWAPKESNACNATADDGVFRAYGLVYFLLKHNITVYWAIDGATPKGSVTGYDVTASGASPIAKKWDWTGLAFTTANFNIGSSINYVGGPFLIDAADAPVALNLIKTDPDFARFRSEKYVDIHEIESTATVVKQVRPLTGPPPRIAILAVNPQPYHKTSLDVMYKYAVAAGLDDPSCTDGGSNCAGGLGPSCDPTVIKKYLNNTLCGFDNCGSTCSSCSSWVEPSPGTRPATPTPSGIQNAKFNAPGTPGKIFDILCDGDFIPPTGQTYAQTQLAQGGYKLLWIPHWDTATVDPLKSPPTTASSNLNSQLQSIASYVGAGNNLFVECLGIGALEGNASLHGIPGTRFQTTAGMQDTTGSGNPNYAFAAMSGFAIIEPNMQIGDFAFPGRDVDGAITTFFPDNVPSGPQSTYVSGVNRLLTGTAGNDATTYSCRYTPKASGTCSPACASGSTCVNGTCRANTVTCNGGSRCDTSLGYASCTPCASGQVSWDGQCVQAQPWDVATDSIVKAPDGLDRGHVAYLGGHDYSPSVNNSPGQTGQTAGTRIVLNTLFNLGFACADPLDANGQPQTCNTGKLGACAQGTLKCASGGGVECVPTQASSVEICDGLDNDCNGLIDDDGNGGSVCNPAVCESGTKRECYSGPAGTAGVGKCKAGKQLCTGGFWGRCGETGDDADREVLPTPEVCNLQDDDCNGSVDDGNLCGPGMQCSALYGVCLPTACNSETLRCPAGFVCSAGACTPDTCASGGVSGPNSPCGPGLVCRHALCVDPCNDSRYPVTCGQGSSCSDGVCMAGGCTLTGCSAGFVCVNGACVDDPCAGTSCPTGTFCRLGDCVRSCAYVDCPTGQLCDGDGFCQKDCGAAGCGAALVCSNGSCVDDPCAGVVCGSGQTCQGGTCVDDPCMHVTCAVGTCQRGQCVGGSITTSETRSVPSPSAKSGCGSAGTGGLASVAALLFLLATRRRVRPQRAPVRARRVVGAGAAAVLLAGAAVTGCSKGASAPSSCPAGQTLCGSSCVDLTRALDNCGACGHACATGFACVAKSGADNGIVGGCAIDTPNPFLRDVSPAVVGAGSQMTLQLTADGLRAGARVRVTGAGLNSEYDVASPTSGPSVLIDFSGVSTGTAEVRLLNVVGDNRFVSNALPITITNTLLLRGVSPGGARQDASPMQLTLSGAGFAQGAVASLKAPAGGVQALPTTFVDSATLTVASLDPRSLAVGAYDLTVTNPGNAVTNVLKLVITEGAPTLSSVNPTCIVVNSILNGSATGTYLYPSSVVRVSGGSIVDSPLSTECLLGTDALGRCQGGQLRVSQDLAGVPAGTYDVVVVNPGSPNALRSDDGAASPIPVQIKASCP